MNSDEEWWSRLDYMMILDANSECASACTVDDDSLVSDFNFYYNFHSSSFSSLSLCQTPPQLSSSSSSSSTLSASDTRVTISANPNTPSMTAFNMSSALPDSHIQTASSVTKSNKNQYQTTLPHRCSSAASVMSSISDASTTTHLTADTSISKSPSFDSLNLLSSSPNLINEISSNRQIKRIFNAERRKGRKIIKIPLLISNASSKNDSGFTSGYSSPFLLQSDKNILFIGRPSDWPVGLAKEYLLHQGDGKYEIALITFKPKSAGEYESLMRYLTDSDLDEINHQDVESNPRIRSINKRLKELEKKKKSTRKAAGGDELQLYSVAATNIGQRKRMEDRYTLFTEESSSKYIFAAVYDGHNGIEVAESARVSVLKTFREYRSKGKGTSLGDSLRYSLLQAECKIISAAHDHQWESGSTALCAAIMGTNLAIASVGDSRAVMCRKGKAYDLTTDHRFSNDDFGKKERLRAEKEGGKVDPDGYLGDAVNVSRALGDYSLKDEGKLIGLSAEPDISEHVLTQEDEFLLLGCDGIFEKLTSQEAVDCVMNSMRDYNGDVNEAAYNLIGQALTNDADDNLTCIILSFHSYHNGPGMYWKNHQALAASSSGAATRKRYDFSSLRNLA